MFDNKISSQGIHYSRYVASYFKELSKLGLRFYRKQFLEWLFAIGLDKREMYEIVNYAENGKLELEGSAERFLRSRFMIDD